MNSSTEAGMAVARVPVRAAWTYSQIEIFFVVVYITLIKTKKGKHYFKF